MLDFLYNLTVRSVIDNCMHVYIGNLKVFDINRLEHRCTESGSAADN